LLAKAGVALLLLWGLGRAALETPSSALHLLLFAGLMLLLIGFLRTRDAALAKEQSAAIDKRRHGAGQ
jgi:hypothetical protein